MNGSEIPAIFKTPPGKAQKDREKTMGNCPGILNFFPRKGKSKDSTTGHPKEAEDGEGESSSAMPAIGRKKECPEELKAPIADLEEKLRSKAPDLTGQNVTPASSCPEDSLLSENSTKDGHTAELGPSSRQMLQSR